MKKCMMMKMTILAMGFTFTVLPFMGNAYEQKQEKKSTKMEKIVVTATKTGHSLEDVPVETVLITRQEIERSNTRTVSGLLDQIPGFNFSQQSGMTSAMGYKNTIRGLNVESRYLLILVDGQRVFTGFHSGGMASAGFSHNVNVVPISMIERIEVVKGPGSALYGSDAVVGVINIITKCPPEETLATAGGGYGTYEAKGKDYLGNTLVDTTRHRYETYATVGGSITENIKGLVMFSHEDNEGIHPTTYDIFRDYVHGRIEITPSDQFRLQAGAEYTAWEEQEDALGDDKEETAPRLYVTADYRPAPMHAIKVRAYNQNLDADFKDPLYGNQQADVSYTDAELQYTAGLSINHLLTAGVEYLDESLDTSAVSNKDIATTSVYLQDEWSLLDERLVLVPGIRFDNNDVYGEELNPKFSAMFKFGKDTTFRASVGRSFKAPSALNTSADPINHVVQWIFPNPDLEPETSVTWQVGVEQGFFDRRLRLSTTFYHTKVTGMINYAATPDFYMGMPVMTFKNLDKAKIQGLEAAADFSIMTGLDVMCSYAFTDAQDENTGDRLIDTPDHSFSARLDYENRAYRWGGYLSVTHTSDQRNLIFASGASPETDDFTTAGIKIWKSFQKNNRLALQAENLFDADLKGSDTIYIGRSIMAKLEIGF